jgi:uncharacterized protein (TIGR00266 family)
MRYEIAGNPDVGDLTVWLNSGEAILAEAGAMSRMSTSMDMNIRLIGGFMRAAVRKMVGGESLFVGEYRGTEDNQHVAFAPAIPGTVVHQKLQGGSLYLTAGSFLACTPDISLKTRFGGLKAFFSGEGAFFIECSGNGDLFFNSYGAVVERDIDGNFTVDTGHVVAWEPTLEYAIGGMGGLKQTLFSGEGLVLKFSGKGKIWMQTRQLGSMAGWLARYL